MMRTTETQLTQTDSDGPQLTSAQLEQDYKKGPTFDLVVKHEPSVGQNHFQGITDAKIHYITDFTPPHERHMPNH